MLWQHAELELVLLITCLCLDRLPSNSKLAGVAKGPYTAANPTPFNAFRMINDAPDLILFLICDTV